MKVSYEHKSDDLLITITNHPPVEHKQIDENTILDFDEFGNIVSIQIMGAKSLGFDPETIIVEVLAADHVVKRPDPAEAERIQNSIREARERKMQRERHLKSIS